MDTEGSSAATLVVFISTCAGNAKRRRAIRRSWFQYKHAADSPLRQEQKDCMELVFIASQGHPELSEEAEAEGDIMLLDTPEGYHMLWRKALVFLQRLLDRFDNKQQLPSSAQQGSLDSQAPVSSSPADQLQAEHTHDGTACSSNDTHASSQQSQQGMHAGGVPAWWHQRHAHPTFVMHADDDSYLRLDMLIPLMQTWPRSRFYWGYIWDGTGARVTQPIRDTRNKSHMPAEQYPLDYYPPFASGCGFVLSWDLVTALAHAAPTLPDYRLLDPPFGIHLCGPPDLCILNEPVQPVHDERVRPYRPLPTFRTDTLVQHYLRPEELAPYHAQALASIKANINTQQHGAAQQQSAQDDTCAAHDQETSSSGNTATKTVASQPVVGPAGADQVSSTSSSLAGGSEAAQHLYDQLVALGLLRR